MKLYVEADRSPAISEFCDNKGALIQITTTILMPMSLNSQVNYDKPFSRKPPSFGKLMKSVTLSTLSTQCYEWQRQFGLFLCK